MTTRENPAERAIVNKFPAKCAVCKTPVDKGAGFAVFEKGKWQTVCTSVQCQKALDAEEAITELRGRPVQQKIASYKDGVVTFSSPYVKEHVEVYRALPGKKWEPTLKVWQATVTPYNLRDIKNLVEGLQYDIVDPALVALFETLGAEEDAPEAVRSSLTIDDPEGIEAAGLRAEEGGARDYQITGVQWLAGRSRGLLGDDMGTGKTAQTLWALPEEGRAIVVAPKATLRNWVKETRRWRPDLEAKVMPQGEFKIPKKGQIWVVTHEGLPAMLEPVRVQEKLIDKAKESIKAIEAFNATKPKTPKKVKRTDIERLNRGVERPTEAQEKALANVVLVVDEAHKAKNPNTVRTQRIKGLSELTERTWFLTGTPLLNTPMDLWGVLSAGGMQNEVFDDWRGFVKLMGGYQESVARGVTVWRFGTPHPTVPDRLRRVMLRRRKDEVLTELPPKVRSEVEVKLTDGRLRAVLDEQLSKWLDGNKDLPDFDAYAKARAMLADAKTPTMLDMVEEFEEQERPLLVFSYHKKPIQALADRPGWGIITGEQSTRERQRVVDAFQAGELKGVGLTIGAGAVGITLTRASDEIFVDLDWTPALNLQAEDRAHRLGQKADSVNVVRLVADHPLDQRILEILDAKITLIEQAVEGTSKPLSEYTDAELAVLNELAARLEEAKCAAPTGGVVPVPEVNEESYEEWQNRLKDQREARAQAIRDSKDAELRNKRIDKLRRKASSLPAVSLTEEQQGALEQGFQLLAGQCDGALTEDDVGFNKADTVIGHWIAAAGVSDEDSITVAYHILRKYVGQLPPDLYEVVYRAKGTKKSRKGNPEESSPVQSGSIGSLIDALNQP